MTISTTSSKPSYSFNGPPRFSMSKNHNNYSLTTINPLVSDNLKESAPALLERKKIKENSVLKNSLLDDKFNGNNVAAQ